MCVYVATNKVWRFARSFCLSSENPDVEMTEIMFFLKVWSGGKRYDSASTTRVTSPGSASVRTEAARETQNTFIFPGSRPCSTRESCARVGIVWASRLPVFRLLPCFFPSSPTRPRLNGKVRRPRRSPRTGKGTHVRGTVGGNIHVLSCSVDGFLNGSLETVL